MMSIVFFSESQFRGKVPRDFENARTEYAWMIALDAPHYPLGTTCSIEYDLGIVIIPKSNPDVDLSHYKKFCKNVAVMQEGPHWYFQDYNVPQQFSYYSTLLEADWVYCHNESDVKYFMGLGCKDVRVMRSLMIPDGIPTIQENSDVTLIGGNMVSWYGGFDSYIIARELDNPIFAPSMGRKQDLEDLIEDIQYLPYYSWREWIQVISEYKIGVHLMRTHAAGTFAMNLGYHGIPVIGYKGLDTQELLHPLTSVDIGDLDKARDLIVQLNEDEKFYKLCSETTLKRFKTYYTEESWKQNWEKTNGLVNTNTG